MLLGERTLDDIDVRIASELQEDCKQPLARLGEIVGLSAPSVMERIRKLEQAGVIRGYHAQLDARKVGLDVTAFIGVSINFPKNIEAFEKQVGEIPEVMECHHVTGGSTLLMKVRVTTTAALEALISRIRIIDGVERTETMIVLSTISEHPKLHLDVPEPPSARTRTRRRKRSA